MNSIPELEMLCEEVMSGQPQARPELVIVRGAPGSGKSTFAKNQFPNHKVFATDDFFMVDGVYKYDKTKIGENHQKCFDAVARCFGVRPERRGGQYIYDAVGNAEVF